MTKEEFIDRYATRSKWTEEEKQRHMSEDYIVMECSCNFEGCPGWAMVNNDPLSIKAQKELYQNK